MVGGPPCKDFLDPICNDPVSGGPHGGTFRRKSKELNDLSNLPSVTRNDVLAAAKRIAGSVERTPLIEAQIGGHTVWLKCESVQTGGAFKLRGASNRLLQLDEEGRRRGVVAFSSGNHAQ